MVDEIFLRFKFWKEKSGSFRQRTDDVRTRQREAQQRTPLHTTNDRIPTADILASCAPFGPTYYQYYIMAAQLFGKSFMNWAAKTYQKSLAGELNKMGK